MSAITVHEFLAIAGIDAERFLLLASAGKLPLHLGPAGELLIELEHLTLESLHLTPQQSSKLPAESSLELQEIIASELVNATPSILQAGLVLALRWRAQSSKS